MSLPRSFAQAHELVLRFANKHATSLSGRRETEYSQPTIGLQLIIQTAVKYVGKIAIVITYYIHLISLVLRALFYLIALWRVWARLSFSDSFCVSLSQ